MRYGVWDMRYELWGERCEVWGVGDVLVMTGDCKAQPWPRSEPHNTGDLSAQHSQDHQPTKPGAGVQTENQAKSHLVARSRQVEVGSSIE